MNLNILKKIIKEEYRKLVTELDVTDPELQSKIDELAEIELLLQEVEDRCKALKAQKLAAETAIMPFLEQVQALKRNYLKTDQYIVYIAKQGGTRTTYEYKDAFKLALTKVNAATKKILEDTLAETEKISPVKSTMGISTPDALDKAKKKDWKLDNAGNELDEATNAWKDKIKSILIKFKSLFVRKTDALEKVNTSIERINMQLASYVKELKVA